MNKMKIMALLLVLSLHGKVLGQEDSVLLGRIESSIIKSESKWRLARKTRARNGQYIGYFLKSGKTSAYVFVALYGTMEEATNGLRNLPGFFEGSGLRMTILPTSILNLGDENYTWEDCCDKRFTGVAFRKGKVVVHVDAPSIEIAQRIALHIAKALTVNTANP